MDRASLLNSLTTKVYGRNLIYHEVIDSTNTFAIELLQSQNVEEGTVILAGRQTNGRGTSGSKWESSTPEGLLLSIIVQASDFLVPISLLPAIAAARTLRELGIDVHLKWPNDLLVGNKKIGGILCESVFNEIGKFWVIGIGLNINQKSFSSTIAEKATSLFQLTNKNFSIEMIFQKFMANFEFFYVENQDIISIWKSYSKMIGKEIIALKGGITMKVQVIDLSPEGYLVVKDNSGKIQKWVSVSDLDISTNY